MIRAVKGSVVVAGVALALFGLAEATQNRPDPIRRGTATELTLSVRTRGDHPPDLAVQGLWGMCQQTVSHARLHQPVVDAGAGRFTVVVAPALGRHSTRRLEGCLEDATVPRLVADVVGRRDLVLR